MSEYTVKFDGGRFSVLCDGIVVSELLVDAVGLDAWRASERKPDVANYIVTESGPNDEVEQLRAQLDAANADRARLREALGGLTTWLSRWRHAVLIRAEGAAQAWDELERLHNEGATLTSTDAAQWLRERDLRVAEAVREACVYHLEVAPRAQGVLVTVEHGQTLARFAADLRALDLADVVGGVP